MVLAPHFEAIKTDYLGVRVDEGVIKVTGEVGTEKQWYAECWWTIYKTVHANLPSQQCYQVLTCVKPSLKGLMLWSKNEASLVDSIQHKLIELHSSGLRVVADLDEAQALSDEALETLRLFSIRDRR